MCFLWERTCQKAVGPGKITETREVDMVRMFFKYSAVQHLFIALVIASVIIQGAGYSCLRGMACREGGALCCKTPMEKSPSETTACCAQKAEPVRCCCETPNKPDARFGMSPSSPQTHQAPCTCHMHASDIPASLPPSSVRIDTSFSTGDFAGFLFSSIVTTDRSLAARQKGWLGPPGSEGRIHQCVWRC